mmetsp:Transcript_33047/g.109187  ORF Transcript_33047/g.109187 Transcript_33047/m.109187 type:complete len:202 (-) Transcript_33047:462-1067(-)
MGSQSVHALPPQQLPRGPRFSRVEGHVGPRVVDGVFQVQPDHQGEGGGRDSQRREGPAPVWCSHHDSRGILRSQRRAAGLHLSRPARCIRVRVLRRRSVGRRVRASGDHRRWHEGLFAAVDARDVGRDEQVPCQHRGGRAGVRGKRVLRRPASCEQSFAAAPRRCDVHRQWSGADIRHFARGAQRFPVNTVAGVWLHDARA